MMKLAFRALRPAAVPSSRQTSHVCRAGKKQGAKKAAKVQVPNNPPPKENAAVTPEQIPTEDPVVSVEKEEAQAVEEIVQAQAEVQQTMTTEEIAAQMAQLRAASKENKQKEGMIQGVLEEVKLISWPTPKSALFNTFLVIVIVAGTSAVLFGVNTLLAEASRVVYSKF
ncbi:hypothetical protein Ndes2526B_g08225 [Nannochloris sp. 'desiccata']